MLKKVFWISFSFFLLTLIFLGVYNFAFKNNTNNPIADPEKYAEAQKKQEEEAPLQSLAFENFLNESVLFPKVQGEDIWYYSVRDKQLKQTSINGGNTKVVVNAVPGTLKRLLWSPNFTGSLALIEDGSGSLWHYIDFKDGAIKPLKKEISRVTWNTLGDGIFYVFTHPATGERSLDTASFTGTNWKKLTDLGKDDYFIATIPQSSQVAFWNRPDGKVESRLESISLTGEGRKTLFTGNFGGDYLWSPNARLLLMSSVTAPSGNTLSLGIMDESGKNYRDLLIPTLTSKVTWSKDSETIYYALPNSFQSGTILPNDYFGKPIITKDTFWKMNVKTGKRERLVPLDEMSQGFDATELMLSPDETKLFFLERGTNKLYKINL